MRTCPDCGERVYRLGCVNCNEAAYIEEQALADEGVAEVERMLERERAARNASPPATLPHAD